MKSRISALVLLASMLLLVSIIPAAGARPAEPDRQRPTSPDLAQRRERAAARAAVEQPAPPPAVELESPIDAIRAERHPEEARRAEANRPAPEMGAASAAPVPPPAEVLPSDYPEPEPGTAVVIASVDNMGQGGNGYSYEPAISTDGRYVAFYSYADDLVSGDWNEVADVFVRDTQENTIERVSISTNDEEGNSDSYQASISADGRYVVFYSYADNLVDDDDNGDSDIFLRDTQTDETSLISRHSNGTFGNWGSYSPVISADGAFVAYYSYANNLVDEDENGYGSDIFLYEIATATTTLVSLSSVGDQGNSYSFDPAISSDGGIVAFYSEATNLVDADENDVGDIFVRDIAGGVTTLVSLHTNNDQGDNYSYVPSLSGDGQIVAFYSYAGNLVNDDFNGSPDVFVHDRGTTQTSMISRHSDGTPGNWESYEPAVSGDGRYVTFYSYADNLIDSDENGTDSDVFLHDLDTGETSLVSKSVLGEQGNWYSNAPAINDDGSIVAFNSGAANLVSYDWNGYRSDVFVRFTGLEELYSISGRVIDENDDGLCCTLVNDISGANVYADNDGYYSIEGLLPGNHGVWAFDDYYYYLFPDTPAAVTLPINAENIDIVGEENNYYTYYYEAIADAYVDEAKKTKNFGLQPFLRVKNAGKDLNSYLKFEVDALGSCAYVDWSEIELFATNGGPDGGELYRTGNDWTETGITWKNAPALDSYYDWFGSVGDNSYEYAWAGVTGNGVYSYAIRNYNKDQVQYDSREGANIPWLYVDWLQEPELTPDAQYYADGWSGLNPLTVQFTDNTDGCVTEWEWDFGDGHTSDEQNPTHIFTEPGYYPVSLTVTNSKGVDRKTYWVEVTQPPNVFYMSLAKKAVVGGIMAEPADIVRYIKDTNSWAMVYDGSAHGTTKNVGSFTFDGTDLLLVFSANQKITGLGTATPFDIVRFTPDNPGSYPLGSGEFSWAFQGKPNGLSKGAEKIDALGLYDWDDYILSTTGTAALPTDPILKPADEDLFGWYIWGNYWDGLWLDGSTISGLAGEDINGVWWDEETNDYYIVITGKFDLGGVKGNDSSIVRLNGNTPSLVDWLAPGATFKGKIDAIELDRVAIMIEE